MCAVLAGTHPECMAQKLQACQFALSSSQGSICTLADMHTSLKKQTECSRSYLLQTSVILILKRLVASGMFHLPDNVQHSPTLGLTLV